MEDEETQIESDYGKPWELMGDDWEGSEKFITKIKSFLLLNFPTNQLFSLFEAQASFIPQFRSSKVCFNAWFPTL